MNENRFFVGANGFGGAVNVTDTARSRRTHTRAQIDQAMAEYDALCKLAETVRPILRAEWGDDDYLLAVAALAALDAIRHPSNGKTGEAKL